MKQNIYDNEAFYENFKSLRDDEINYNDCIETPILFSMLPDLCGKRVLDVGCGMGQHAKQYSESGAAYVLGIDISERMLAYAVEHNGADNIEYRKTAMEDLGEIEYKFDLITSSLVFDYAEDLLRLFRDIRSLMADGASFVFSMSHPMATAHTGKYDRFMRTESGERQYAIVTDYFDEGRRSVKWGPVDDYELYHRTVSSIVNSIIGAGLVIEECRESQAPEELLKKYPSKFGGTIHRPDFIFFRCEEARISAILP